ncbi:hypothetical protein F5884DRAFT_899111 [Xylogone sp. PMI_703]|nr:hypothetical protein F5884DRAFT_899111 [Xylogone sp. PMI_703]
MDFSRTSKAEWPSDIPAPQPVVEWLSTLFALLDLKEPDVPEKVAALYTDDAEVHSAAGIAIGKEEIIAARKNSWALMDTRRHDLLRVYTKKADFSDLILVCNFTALLKTGNAVSEEFIVNLIFRGDTSTNPKGCLYKIWSDKTGFMKALGYKIEKP